MHVCMFIDCKIQFDKNYTLIRLEYIRLNIVKDKDITKLEIIYRIRTCRIICVHSTQ